ncbi:MAG: hypothetical protein MZV64_19995 [Ignavibacteriales bacterium]|nr:hypothetical protein [Ignavibacteriales bacterium]
MPTARPSPMRSSSGTRPALPTSGSRFHGSMPYRRPTASGCTTATRVAPAVQIPQRCGTAVTPVSGTSPRARPGPAIRVSTRTRPRRGTTAPTTSPPAARRGRWPPASSSVARVSGSRCRTTRV